MLLIWVIIPFLSNTLAGKEQKWTYEIIDIAGVSSNPNWVSIDYSVERISRGKYGFSGILDIKEDIYDDYRVGAKFERSIFRSGPFTPLPMSIDNVTFSEGVNTIYKEVLMPAMQNCSRNAPFIEEDETFVGPLTKRTIELSKCDVLTENLPNVLMDGYYKFTIGIYGKNYVYVETLSLVENPRW